MRIVYALAALLLSAAIGMAQVDVVSPAPATRAATTKPLTKQSYQSFAMTHSGDVERGRRLFLDAQRLACARCHSLDGKGAAVGPDLFAAGDKFGRRELVEAVLAPSATIAAGDSPPSARTRHR